MTRNSDKLLTVATLSLVLTAGESCGRESARRESGKKPSPPAPTLLQPTQFRMSPDGLSRIRRSEAFIPKVYDDGVGNETIGYGHMIHPGESYGAGITEAQARELFEQDVARIVQPALDRIKVPLTQNQVDALGSFIYNVGPGNFQRSVLPEVNSGDSAGVIDAMSDYVKGRNQRTGERVALRGLIKRRREEVALYNTPPGSVSLDESSRDAHRWLASDFEHGCVESSCLFDI